MIRSQGAGFPECRGRVRPQIYYWNEKAQNRGFLLHFLLGLWEEPTSLGPCTVMEGSQQKIMGHHMSTQKDGFGAILVPVWCSRDSDVPNLPNHGIEHSQVKGISQILGLHWGAR